MTFMKKKISYILYMSNILLITVLLIASNDTINNLFVKYNDDFAIEQVAINVPKSEEPKEEVPAQEPESPIQQPIATPISYNNNWSWPTDAGYTITQYYGYSHNALDIVSSGWGANIYSANSGTVVMVRNGCTVGDLGCNGRGGNYIVIKHNIGNYYTSYMHLSRIYVNEGDTVGSGQLIGAMGNTGNVIPVPPSPDSTLGTHLHFNLYIGMPYQGGYTINPMNVY